ncbi:phosphatidylserine decarboxylase family protein [bacterium]|nr:MAG: phosphatidylserine decarboxylase family protein [bacterium]
MTEYGKDVVLKIFFFTLLLDGAAFLINYLPVKITLFSLSIIFFSFTLYFFRDPDRKLPADYTLSQIVSPADGTVVLIEEIPNKYKEIFGNEEKIIQLSIFLSPLNVHVNRIPFSGIIKYFRYVKGDYIVAFENKASERNERTEIGIINNKGQSLLFRQIAGYVARRIVCYLNEEDEVTAGEKFGMIKFGSRADILFKRGTRVMVNKNSKVKAGKTIIAEFE